MDDFDIALWRLLDEVTRVANEHDRTTRDALIYLSVFQTMREEEKLAGK